MEDEFGGYGLLIAGCVAQRRAFLSSHNPFPRISSQTTPASSHQHPHFLYNKPALTLRYCRMEYLPISTISKTPISLPEYFISIFPGSSHSYLLAIHIPMHPSTCNIYSLIICSSNFISILSCFWRSVLPSAEMYLAQAGF